MELLTFHHLSHCFYAIYFQNTPGLAHRLKPFLIAILLCIEFTLDAT